MVPRLVVMMSSPEDLGPFGRAWSIHKPSGQPLLAAYRAGNRSEPIRPHLPVAPPPGEMVAAELQHDARIHGIEAGHRSGPLHQIALRAARAGEIDERRLHAARDLVLG